MKKVMVVEDDPDTLELLDTLLSGAGYQPVLFADSEDIPGRVAREQPDLIVLDLLVEPNHGMEVLASISEVRRHPPVLLVSAEVRGIRGMRQIAQRLGCYDFIEKPFDVDDFLGRVHAGLELVAA